MKKFWPLLVLLSACSRVPAVQNLPYQEYKAMFDELEASKWHWADRLCADSYQTIRFDLASETMTLITHNSILGQDQRKETVYLYRILDVGKNRISTKIVGEDRLDKNGNPVKWDLILKPNESFYWRRNDWDATGGTKSMLKCPE